MLPVRPQGALDGPLMKNSKCEETKGDASAVVAEDTLYDSV